MVRPERLRADPIEAFLGRTKSRTSTPARRRTRSTTSAGHVAPAARPDDHRRAPHRAAARRAPRREPGEGSGKSRSDRDPREYLTEIAPYVGELDLERFLGRIPGHILTRDEVGHCSAATTLRPPGWTRSTCSVRSRVGLLGHLHHDWVRGAWVQRFCGRARAPSSPTGSCRARNTISCTPCCRT